MDRNLYDWITIPIIWGIWLWITVSGIRAYITTSKVKGMPLFMTPKQLKASTNPEIVAAVSEWRKKSKKLFLIWMLTAIVFLALSMFIDKTIGFKD